MSSSIKKYTIENIRNRNVYRRITNDLSKIDFIESVSIDKEKNMLFIEPKQGIDYSFDTVLQVFKNYEKKTNLVEQIQKETYRKVLYLKGLDCGNCAMKIEGLAKRSMNHEQILVDFATTRFIIETADREI